MVRYYLCRDVDRGANCSYKPGRTLLNDEPNFSFADDAQRMANRFNECCHVAGVHYLVVPWPEEKPFEADYYAN